MYLSPPLGNRLHRLHRLHPTKITSNLLIIKKFRCNFLLVTTGYKTEVKKLHPYKTISYISNL